MQLAKWWPSSWLEKRVKAIEGVFTVIRRRLAAESEVGEDGLLFVVVGDGEAHAGSPAWRRVTFSVLPEESHQKRGASSTSEPDAFDSSSAARSDPLRLRRTCQRSGPIAPAPRLTHG